MTKIKICGLSRVCDVAYANELDVDYVGFVFAPQSRRYISWKTASELREALDEKICPVGVFVNESVELVAKLLNTGLIDMAQLHGQEDTSYIQRLRKLSKKPVIQAFSIRFAADVQIATYSKAEEILLDNGSGGSGESFDWSLAKKQSRRFFLAGGLSADNVAAAIRLARPYAVDVSSAVEHEGFKDFDKMRRFVQAVRGK